MTQDASRPAGHRRLTAPAAGLLAAALLTLAACGGDDEVEPPPTASEIEIIRPDLVFACPDVSVVADVAEIRRYDGAVADPSRLVAQLTVGDFRGGCEYDDDGVTVALDLDFDAQRGPRYGGAPVPFDYFVAVVDGTDRILAKEVFATEVMVEPGSTRGQVTEQLAQRIPLDRRALGPTYQILLGFQVSEAELQALRNR